MWVRTTLTIKRWTEAKTGVRVDARDESDSMDMNRLPSWKRGRLRARMSSSTDLSTFSSEGECKETERCCWKHRQCARHITHPVSDYGHHKLYLHTMGHCDCDSRLKDCSEKANSSSSRDMGTTCSRDGGSNCFNILQTPCFELIPEEECMEPFWYSWCNSYRPLSVAVIHHPVHHKYGADNLNGDEEEEEENQPPITTQVGPTATPSDRDNSSVTGSPDLAVPITIWRSDSPREEKSQDSKVLKKIKKKEKDDEMMDEKKLKKKVKKGKLTKKKSPVKSESSPAELSRSVSPRELARTSESSPESREELESEDSYNNRGQREPSSEDVVESSSSSKKREKCTPQAKKNGTKTSQTRKVTKRKSPPVSNPSHS